MGVGMRGGVVGATSEGGGGGRACGGGVGGGGSGMGGGGWGSKGGGCEGAKTPKPLFIKIFYNFKFRFQIIQNAFVTIFQFTFLFRSFLFVS